MIRNFVNKSPHTYHWIDIYNPDKNELQEIANKYGLLEQSVQDSLQPDHLPKYERLKYYTFSILRIYSSDNDIEADTVQELTDKIAIFIGDQFIITIHRNKAELLDRIYQENLNNGDCKTPLHVYIEIVRAALLTYDEPIKKLTHSIEYYEELIFLKDQRKPILKGLYFLKRKVDVIRRVLMVSYDIVDQIDPEENSNAYTRDVRDLYVKQQSMFDSLSENTNHLLNIYFNIAAQKTNETIRVLTIFSVFFLPLTFIVGIYGMNFEFMPELKWKLGYPAVYIVMAVVTVSIYIWFKRKKWL
ncbi:magnesium transporter CorA family protein [Longitalea arenae]|uniref:magnesium transporter CorA family protein n=1 Tax=Longitalea arenae TaxID=2812558 RepID=UPI00196874E1|nr:CorA family divalent cation transporter [Longitalea arenae]